MEDIEKRPGLHEPGIDRRTLFLLIAAFILGFLVFYAIDNREYFLAPRVSGEEWEAITTRVVEQSCLEQAKRVAVSEGYGDVFVLSCSCLNVQSEVLKTFDCNVNTIDVVNPARKVLVHCYKLNGQCTIASEKGLQTYNLSELEQYILQ
jgi:hypothetical protein